jgi:hypothetical protein
MLFNLIFLIIILLILLNNKKENMINPKLYIKHLNISPNENLNRLSQREADIVNKLRDCKNRPDFYRCINSVNIPEVRETKKIKKYNVNYMNSGNPKHLFPIHFN